MKPWKINSSKVVYENKLFKIKREKCIVPRTGKPYNYYYEDSPNWVNIIPVTKEGKILLIKQYRNAVREFTIEIPGGIIDREDKNPLAAAKRELLEETGFGGGRYKLIGICQPNPAIINNRTYTYLAKGVYKKGLQDPDSTEEIEVIEVTPRSINTFIKQGKIKHTLVITAFYYALPYL